MSEFVSYLHEVFEQFGTIRSRKMFGGHGIYHNDLMFGLVADDELYLKTDAENLSEFTDRDLDAFEFNKDGKLMKMSYYRAPEEIYDDPDEAAHWGNIAYAAAVRANNKKTRKKKR
ncbi:MAG: TfoX/Sxy family protein [Pseudomonadota bacterium]